MGTIHALQRRVEVAQQGLALFEEETRGTGARLTDAFGRIEDVLREKDFQLVRRELEVQRLARENAQARMLLETLLETVEQRKLPSLREVIEQFERKLAASTALNGGGEPPAESGPDIPAHEPPAEAQSARAESAVETATPLTLAEFMAAEAGAKPASAEPVELAPAPAVAVAAEPVPAPAPLAAFADPAGDMTVTIPVAEEAVQPDDDGDHDAEDDVSEPQAEFLPPAAVVRVQPAVDPNEELIADARAQLRSRRGGARLIEEEQRRYAYKVWLGPILIGVGALGPLALVLARIAH